MSRTRNKPVLSDSPTLRNLLQAMGSLKITVVCLVALMILVVLCTIDQVALGTYLAVQKDIRTFLAHISFAGGRIRLSIPGGGLVGGILILNLAAAHIVSFDRDWRKIGIWLTHLGVLLLILAEFVTGLFAVETQLPISEGASANYTLSTRKVELIVGDATPSGYDQIYSIPQSLFSRKSSISHPDWPFTLLIKKYYANSDVQPRIPGPNDLPSMATRGVGAAMAVQPLQPATNDDDTDQISAFVEPIEGDRSLGTWLLSSALKNPQVFSVQGRTYYLAIRPERYYLPFTLTLKKFSHDIYPGTDIPKNFSSLVHLIDPERGEHRDVLIYMNHPLRYGGQSFYQASFGKNDSLSILQVVSNPGRWLPYISCTLVALGLLIHFLMSVMLRPRERLR